MKTDSFPAQPNLNFGALRLIDRYVPKRLSAKITQYYCRYRSRRQLLTLSEERLNDIGISPEKALIEAKKPFWR